jgi:hypothetical protein
MPRPAPAYRLVEASADPREKLILYLAAFGYPHQNAIAATLAWIAQTLGRRFDVYYDAFHVGRHFSSGNPHDSGLYGRQAGPGLLTGGLIGGGRHREALALALQRFETTVFCSGSVAFSPLLSSLSGVSGATVHQEDEENLVDLYEAIFDAFALPWPELAVLVNRAPTPALEGIDAYCYPEIYYRQAIGIEASARPSDLRRIRERGVRQVLTCGIADEQQALLRDLGFRVQDLDVVRAGDDYAATTVRLAQRWREHRRGWIIGDPTLVSYWIPSACHEDRAAIYGVPTSRAIELLGDEFGAANGTPVLGRQFDDSDFFTLSRLGKSFQVIDPNRPPLPQAQLTAPHWPANVPDPCAGDPTDAQLREYAAQGRVLSSLAFWTGMIRETENLYGLMDLIAMTGLRAGLVVTDKSLAWSPSPLDLLFVPREQGGVYPGVELLLGSCGNGVAIESLMTPAELGDHLARATAELERLGVPKAWRPQGWWTTMDAPMIERTGWRATKPVGWSRSARFGLQIRFHRSQRSALGGSTPGGGLTRRSWRQHFGARIRGSAIESMFEAYRPYENFEPGPFNPQLAEVAKASGLSYLLTKSGFGSIPRVAHQDADFIALNYTAGQWDGWTPFETINDVGDLRRAERSLLRRAAPGWLLGTVDSCLWTFSGELWRAAPKLHAIAEHVAKGGDSGRLINVAPRVVARYARLITAAR